MKDIEWINTHEAARLLGITTRTLYRFIDQGQLSAYRFGRVFRLKVSDIETFIENSKVEPGTLKHLYPDTQVDDLGLGTDAEKQAREANLSGSQDSAAGELDKT